MKKITAVVLAAGRGTRMKSDTPKVMHGLLGKPIIWYVLNALKAAGIKDIIVVAGYGSRMLKGELGGARMVLQKKLLGSGDAVNSAKRFLKFRTGDILVTCGDAPLIRPETLKRLIGKHRSSGASATVLTAKVKDPSGYGRMIRDDNKKILKIAEDKDASVYEGSIDEINVGTYCFKYADLFAALSKVRSNNSKKEFYLTDTLSIIRSGMSKPVESVLAEDESEVIGINTRADLAEASMRLKNMVLRGLMADGVTIEDPSTTIIHPGVKIGRDTVIKPNTIIGSNVTIGKGCEIGPFARIRPGTRIADSAEIGNFVELVRTTIGKGTKVKHHTYLGDAVVGKGVNVGAATITANYDGKNKHKTVIEDGAFIGVGAILIAPVKIGRRATVGAGCVVPKGHNVPPGVTVVGVPAKILK
ncbi:MAG: NTP transferase domain-containing protein [Candidatus Omnitrophica bacterium]|nr:NTP transferase domain-containing protein [Candidatus Omnitrophota bacterium]